MAGWKRNVLESLPVYQASTMSWLPHIMQGFTTRIGGVSDGALQSLNMSANVDDAPKNVIENRRRAVTAIAPSAKSYVAAQQVHGSEVAIVEGPVLAPIQGVDALVTDVPDIALMLMFADCVPIFFASPAGGAIGIAHSGWKGTTKNIAARTVESLRSVYGIEPTTLLVAIGPSISFERYEVSLDVADALKNATPQTGAPSIMPQNEFSGKWLANLRLVIYNQLLTAGVSPDKIAVSDDCTFEDRRDFFSHRRDGGKGVPTGRMAGIIAMKSLRAGL